MFNINYVSTLLSREFPHILEFGVYKGYTISQIKKYVREDYKIYGFDSFEGLPEDWENTVCKKGVFSTNGAIPSIPGVKFFKGLFDDTIKEYLKEADNISLLHVDCDLYSSTKTVLWNLNDYIKKDTIIVFDEWFYCSDYGYKFNSDHEQKCFYEWCREFNRDYDFFDDNTRDENAHERKLVRIIK